MTQAYYDRLAPYYKLLYPDWEASLRRQAQVLDGVLREFFGDDARNVLDAACGIGTQSIGLARLGYRLAGSDLSPAAVEHARGAARAHGAEIDFRVADMRRLWDAHRRTFDVVIACDNAVPHLLNDRQILQAFRQFHRCLRPGGGCVISVRDYARLERPDSQLYFNPRRVHSSPAGRIVLFDVWDFDGEIYEMTTYLVEDDGGAQVQTQVIRGGKYYCVTLAALEDLFRQAGFPTVHTLPDRFFQPLIVAVKPPG